MHLRTSLAGIIAAIVMAASSASVAAQVNDFEDGTTQGWQTNLLGVGGAPQPTVQAGGAGGPSDDYLLATSLGGSGPGSRLNIINPGGWSGNYLTNGVSGFSARLINLGSSDLYIRLLFEDPGPMTPPANIAFSGDPFFLPVGSGWTNTFFSASSGALLAGLGSIDAALANTTTIRLYHSFADTFPNPPAGISPVNGVLGLDDFRAVGGIPEPSTWAMMIGGFAMIAGAMRLRRKKAQRAPTKRVLRQLTLFSVAFGLGAAPATSATAADFIFDTDPFTGSTALTDPGRQVVGGEPFISFDIGADRFVFDPSFFAIGGTLNFDNDFVGNLATSGLNVIVLETLDNDSDPATAFGAGTAANLLAGQITTDGAGFFVYYNSGLDLPRLVYSTNLSDPTADLKILARMTNLSGNSAALSSFTAQNFGIRAAVPEPATWAMMLVGFGFVGSALRAAKRRRSTAYA